MKHLGPVALLICLIASPLAAWAGSPKTLEQNLQAAGRFKTYLELQKIAAPGKSGAARSARTYLVPNDAAFAKLPPAVLEKLKSDPALARKFLDTHTLPGRVTVDDMVGPRRSASNQLRNEQGAMLAFKSAAPADVAAPVPATAPAALALTSETVPAPAPATGTVAIAETAVVIPQQNLNIAPPPQGVEVPAVPNIAAPTTVIDLGMYSIPPIVIEQPKPTSTATIERTPLAVTGLENDIFKIDVFKDVEIIGQQSSLSGGGSAYELQGALWTLFNQSWMPASGNTP